MVEYQLVSVDINTSQFLEKHSHYTLLSKLLASQAKSVKTVYAILPKGYSFDANQLNRSAGMDAKLALEAFSRYIVEKTSIDQILLDDFESQSSDPGIKNQGFDYLEVETEIAWILNVPTSFQSMNKFLSMANGIVHAALIGLAGENLHTKKRNEDYLLDLCNSCKFFAYSAFHDESFLIFER